MAMPAQRRFKVESRDKEIQKVSLALYREESQKIFDLLKRFSPFVEKASCDEAFIDVTKEVDEIFNNRDPLTDQINTCSDQHPWR